MDTLIRTGEASLPLPTVSQMSDEHTASWERWRAQGAASDRRTQAFMRGVAIAIGAGIAAAAVIVFAAR